MRDYYEILGINKNSSEDEIKRAYRSLAKKYHPDLNPNNAEAEAKFKEVNQAYEILSDSEKRGRYDRFGHAGVDPQAGGGYGGGGGFEDIFGDIFDIFGGGGFGRTSRRSGPTKGEDLRYNLKLDFKEAIFGVEKEIQYRRTENCSSCSGTGAKAGSHKETCPTCKGRGEVRYAQNSPFGQFVRTTTCDACNGSGEIIKEKCTDCRGTGKQAKTRKIKVKVPAGVDTDSIISMREEGEAGEKGGPNGDLYIYIYINEDPIFTRSGNNIYLNVPITFVQAALGAEIDVPTLEGISKYTIEPGTMTGTEFKLKGLGVPQLRNSGRGDLYFTVQVQTPKKLSERQKELLREFAKETGEEFKDVKETLTDKINNKLHGKKKKRK